MYVYLLSFEFLYLCVCVLVYLCTVWWRGIPSTQLQVISWKLQLVIGFGGERGHQQPIWGPIVSIYEDEDDEDDEDDDEEEDDEDDEDDEEVRMMTMMRMMRMMRKRMFGMRRRMAMVIIMRKTRVVIGVEGRFTSTLWEQSKTIFSIINN